MKTKKNYAKDSKDESLKILPRNKIAFLSLVYEGFSLGIKKGRKLWQIQR